MPKLPKLKHLKVNRSKQLGTDLELILSPACSISLFLRRGEWSAVQWYVGGHVYIWRWQIQRPHRAFDLGLVLYLGPLTVDLILDYDNRKGGENA